MHVSNPVGDDDSSKKRESKNDFCQEEDSIDLESRSDLTNVLKVVERNKLPHIDRAILQENESAIAWRWDLAQNDFDWKKSMEAYFPGQERLFNLLEVISLDQAMRFSEVSVPLFRISLPSELHLLPCKPQSHPFAPGIAEENNSFLQNRLNCMRLNESEADVVFDLKKYSSLLRNKTSGDLKIISQSPGVRVMLAVDVNFFEATLYASEKMTIQKRSQIAMMNLMRFPTNL
jgi:hypothetical protein